MNLYLILFHNFRGVQYEYFIYADKIKYAHGKTDVQFITNNEIVRLVRNFDSIIKLSDKQFDERYLKDDGKYSSPTLGTHTKEDLIKETNRWPDSQNYI